jgi:predicted DNA binding CopG/RHH family protein
MKKRSKDKAIKGKKPNTRPDAQLQEFSRRDLGDDLKATGAGRFIRRRKALPTSLLLEPELIEQLREKGSKRGLGYQTMLKLIVREHLDEY